MSQISRKVRAPRADPRGRALKPYVPGRPAATTKLIRLDEADLKLIERAAKSREPPPSSSWYIVQAALARARADLRLPAAS
ncbi:MAG: hypothetical protein JWO19_4443 [Bryobacterales bacterium]|nr:hypothetical protein [Bryobacterales bacterium]